MAGYVDKGWVCDIPKDKYYVYALFDSNGFPFYIGKGRNQRVNSHMKPSNRREISHKNRKIDRLLQAQGYVRREILAFCTSEQDAYSLEESLIKSYGLRIDGGCLTNVLKSHSEFSLKARKEKVKSDRLARQSRVSDQSILEAYYEYKYNFVSAESLANKLNVSSVYLCAVFRGAKRKDLNLSAREERPVTLKVTSDKAFAVVNDRKNGMTYSQLCIKYDLPKTTVSRICGGVGVYASVWERAGTGNGTGKSVSARDNSAANLEGSA